MNKIRIIAEFNIDDEDDDYTDSLYEAMRMLRDEVDRAICNSDAMECEAFGDPILADVRVEEEHIERTWEEWQF